MTNIIIRGLHLGRLVDSLEISADEESMSNEGSIMSDDKSMTREDCPVVYPIDDKGSMPRSENSKIGIDERSAAETSSCPNLVSSSNKNEATIIKVVQEVHDGERPMI